MKYKLILFDLDGTILNTLSDLANSVNYALRKNNLQEISKDMVKAYIGNGIKKLCELSSRGINTEEVYEDFKKYYMMHLCDESYVYKNVAPLLLELKKRGYMLGILSNKKDSAVKEISRYYFPLIFDFAYGEREGILRKPDAMAIELICKEYNISRTDVLYVGDSDVDILFCKNSNIDYAICTYGFRDKIYLEKLKPMSLIDDPIDLLKLL